MPNQQYNNEYLLESCYIYFVNYIDFLLFLLHNHIALFEILYFLNYHLVKLLHIPPLLHLPYLKLMLQQPSFHCLLRHQLHIAQFLLIALYLNMP